MIIWISVAVYLLLLTRHRKIGFLYYQLLTMTVYLASLSFVQTLDITLPLYLIFSVLPYTYYLRRQSFFNIILLLLLGTQMLISICLNGLFVPVSVFIVRYSGLLCYCFVFENMERSGKMGVCTSRFFFTAALCEGIITLIGIFLSSDNRLMLNYQCTVGCISTSLIALCAYNMYIYADTKTIRARKRKMFPLAMCMLFFSAIACRSGTRGYIIVCIAVMTVSICCFAPLKAKGVGILICSVILLVERHSILHFFLETLRMGVSTGRRQAENLFILRFFSRSPWYIKLFGAGISTAASRYSITNEILSEMTVNSYTYRVLSDVNNLGFHNCWFTVLYTFGIVGFILFCFIYLRLFKKVLKIKAGNSFKMCMLTFLGAYAVLLFFRWTATSGIAEFAVFSFILSDMKKTASVAVP